MTGNREPATGADLARLLGRDYWLVRSIPRPGTNEDTVAACVQEHVAWLLGLERQDVLLASGPLLSGPGTGPGSGLTILRAPDEETARKIADGDPFVRHGLRTFELYRWRLNEGSIGVRISLGTGTYDWH
ncbi:MAG TPA: YciI family protein [Streptosporangiaceae bacterium]|jgi:hypothetical protein